MSGTETEVGSRRIVPPVSNISAPFWDATRERQLVLQYCTRCSRSIWFPRVLCPHCWSRILEWRNASGLGTVYAVSVQHRPSTPHMKDRVPYAVVLVDLDEGVRLMSNMVNCAVEEISIGQHVRASWEPLPDGRNLVVFEPAQTLAAVDRAQRS